MAKNKKTKTDSQTDEAFWEGINRGMFFGVILFIIAAALILLVMNNRIEAVGSHYANCAYNSDLVRQGILAKNFSPITTTLGQIEYMRLGEQLQECAIKLP